MTQQIKVAEWWWEGTDLHVVSEAGEHWQLVCPTFTNISFPGLDFTSEESVTIEHGCMRYQPERYEHPDGGPVTYGLHT